MAAPVLAETSVGIVGAHPTAVEAVWRDGVSSDRQSASLIRFRIRQPPAASRQPPGGEGVNGLAPTRIGAL
jgi:hypothetical protein